MLKQTDHDVDDKYFTQYQQTPVIYITSYKKVVTFKFLFAAKSRFLKYFVSNQFVPPPPVRIGEEKDGHQKQSC